MNKKLSKEALKQYREKFGNNIPKPHEDFMDDVAEASSLPAQTQRALGPESEEDISMYAEDKQNE